MSKSSLKLISFVGAAMVLGLERRVALGEPYAGPGGASKQDLTIEGVNADDARAILAALDKGATVTPPDVAEVTKAAAASAPAPAPEKPKPVEPAVAPAAQPESRRRRAATPPPVPPPPPPPEEDEEDEEEEDEKDEDVDNDDEEEEEEDDVAGAPPPIPDELKAPAVPMKKFVQHFVSLGLKTEAQMQAALVALVPQCPALQKIGEAPDILRRLQQTRTVLGIKD